MGSRRIDSRPRSSKVIAVLFAACAIGAFASSPALAFNGHHGGGSHGGHHGGGHHFGGHHGGGHHFSGHRGGGHHGGRHAFRHGGHHRGHGGHRDGHGILLGALALHSIAGAAHHATVPRHVPTHGFAGGGARHHAGHGGDGGQNCQAVSKQGVDEHGRPARIGGTMCFDGHGASYIVPGSRYVMARYE